MKKWVVLLCMSALVMVILSGCATEETSALPEEVEKEDLQVIFNDVDVSADLEAFTLDGIAYGRDDAVIKLLLAEETPLERLPLFVGDEQKMMVFLSAGEEIFTTLAFALEENGEQFTFLRSDEGTDRALAAPILALTETAEGTVYEISSMTLQGIKGDQGLSLISGLDEGSAGSYTTYALPIVSFIQANFPNATIEEGEGVLTITCEGRF